MVGLAVRVKQLNFTLVNNQRAVHMRNLDTNSFHC